jgi:adenylate cyclase
VIAEPDDIYGDGVNVAARLEALAEPGGICISRVVRDQIRDKLPYPFEDRGEQSVKNIARSVRVYALRPETVAELPTVSVSAPAPQSRRIATSTIAASVVAVTAITSTALLLWPSARPPPAPPEIPATPAALAIPPPAIAPRLSIVVLPFANLSNDPEQPYFADGITEDLTTDLSRISHMLVISRSSAFTYKDKPVNAKQIGRDLGVRYVLEGSVRRSGNTVRISAQLIDAATDTHLWAERFDRDMGDLFALQADITRQIAIALNSELIIAEAARPTEHPDVLDYILRGRAAQAKPPTRDNYVEAISWFEHAVALDPQSVEAQSRLASALTGRVFSQMTNSRAADIARAKELSEQSLAISPRSSLAHFAKGQVLRAENRCDEAIPEYEMAIASNRNFAIALFSLGFCKMQAGAIDETIPLEEQAIRLSPRDPYIFTRYLAIGQVHLLQSRTEEAIAWLEKARAANPASPFPRAWLASAYALKGDRDHAVNELAEAHRLGGGSMGYYSINRMRAGYWGTPAIRALYEANFFAGLRKAGVPEE